MARGPKCHQRHPRRLRALGPFSKIPLRRCPDGRKSPLRSDHIRRKATGVRRKRPQWIN